MSESRIEGEFNEIGRTRRRLGYAELPGEVRASIEGWLSSKITGIHPVSHGFSPGMVARADLSDGRRVFIKSVGEEINEDSASLYRDEIGACEAMPDLPNIPRLLWSHDSAGWVTMIFEYVAGRPPVLPWDADELARVIRAVEDLTISMTPPPASLRDISEVYGPQFTGWRELAELPTGDPVLGRLDPWAAERLASLAALEAGWSEAAEHRTLLHGDLRSDNVLVSPDRVVVVDWPWACVGPGWYDLMMMLPSVRLEGGPEPWEIFDSSRVARSADPAAVAAMLAALTGFFVRQSLLPSPPGIPTLREFQARQGEVALTWLKRHHA